MRVQHTLCAFVLGAMSVALAVFAQGCGQPESNNNLVVQRNEPATLRSHVRVVYVGKHQGLQIEIDGEEVKSLEANATDSDYIPAREGSQQLRLWDANSRSVLVEKRIDVEPGQRYTLYAVETSEGIFSHWEKVNHRPQHSTEMIYLRVLHVATGTGPLDLWERVDNNSPRQVQGLQNITSQQLTSYTEVPLNTEAWTLTFSGYDNSLLQIEPKDFTPARRYTLILRGSLTRQGERGLQANLFAEGHTAASAREARSTVNLTLDVRLRMYHNATLDNHAVRLLLNERLFLSKLTPGERSVEVSVPAGTHQLRVVSNHNNKVLIDEPVHFDEKKNYSLFLTRIDSEFSDTPAYHITQHLEANPPKQNERAVVRIFQAIKDYPTVSIRIGDKTQKRISSVTFRELTKSFMLEPGTYPIHVAVPKYQGMEISFASLKLEAGHHYTLALHQMATGEPLRTPDTIKQRLRLYCYTISPTTTYLEKRKVTQARHVGRLLFVHASPSLRARALHLGMYLNNQQVTTLSPSRQYSGYLTDTAGEHTLTVRAPNGKVLATQTMELERGQRYSVYLYDNASGTPTLWVSPDLPLPTDPTKAWLRVLHLRANLAPISLLLDNKALFQRVAYKQTKAFFPLPPGKHQAILQLSDSNTNIWRERVHLLAGQSYTLLLKPSADNRSYDMRVLPHRFE